MQRSGREKRNLDGQAFLGLTFFSLILWRFYLEYIRPADVYSFLSPLKLGGISMVVLLYVWLAKCEKSALKEPLIKAVGILILQMALLIPFARNNYFALVSTQTVFIYMCSMVLPLVAIIKGEDRVRAFFFHWVVMNALVALIVVKNGGTGTGNFLADENDVGLALCFSLPYAFYQIFDRKNSKGRKAFFIAATILILMAAIYTKSRGALVGLVTVFFFLWVFSEKKIKSLFQFTLVALLLGGVLVSFLPPGYVDRMMTANDPNNSTRVERLYSWAVAWKIYKDNPILGVGSGNFQWNAGTYEKLVPKPKGQPPIAGRASHSLYFTILPELGTVGALIIGWIWFSIYRSMRKVMASVRSAPENKRKETEYYALLARAVIVSLAAYLSSGAFITVLYYPHQWIIIGFAIIISNHVFTKSVLNNSISEKRRASLPAQ